jgi:penicillin-binding protein 2
MLIFDQLKKDDLQLRLVAIAVLGGLGVLLGGLWWVQVVNARDYQANLETQSFRTVRIPAVRGKILDRNGLALAENRPTYNVSLYLEELRSQFRGEYERSRPIRTITNSGAFWLRWLGSPTVTTQYVRLKKTQKVALAHQARYSVASNVVAQISQRLQLPLSLNATNFERHYQTRLALPCPVLTDVTPAQIARFEEQSTSPMGVDLELQSTRYYPFESTAAHVLGHLRRDDDSKEGEEAFFSFRLPDYRGVIGVEYGFDKELRGTAGAKSVLVNNAGYRQTENVWSEAKPGENVVTTIDLGLQQAAERALQVHGPAGPATRGAVVVMDVHTGDILAMASSPTFNPNSFLPSLSLADGQRLAEQDAEKNRATFENYQPGSIFKTVVGLACLEAGLDPNATIDNPGYIDVGRMRVHDLARPGAYDFHRALKLSSNTYFVDKGLHVAGIANIVKLGQRLHLGELTGLLTRQEAPGIFPSLKKVGANWRDGDTANVCIGQGPIAVTPIQMAVLASALANGGKVLWPRLVARIEAVDPTASAPPIIFPDSRVRDDLGVKASSLQIVRKAMLADVEEDGTGRAAAVQGMRICGKTGTAQVKNKHNETVGETTWFLSFAPYEEPRYAVVVMVEMEARRGSGGGTCGPVAKQIYTVIRDLERAAPGKPQTLAKNHSMATRAQ